MKKYDFKTCPLCKAPLVRETRNVNVVYKDKTFSYLQPRLSKELALLEGGVHK